MDDGTNSGGRAAARSTAWSTGSPVRLCPDSPADCPAYEDAAQAAVLTQLHTVFAGAAVAAALAAVAALVLLRGGAPVRGPARA